MAKRQIILTQEQLNEICGDNSTYLDGLALTPDLADNYSNEITTNGGLDGAYPDPLTTDEYGKEITKTRRVTGFGNRWGAAPTLEEMSKKDWEDKGEEYDEIRDKALAEWGITTLRYSNESINKNFTKIAEDILEKLGLTFGDLKPLK